MLKVALSFSSVEGARRNMDAELPDWDFEKARQDAHDVWNAELSRIEVETENEEAAYTLTEAFPNMKNLGGGKLSFCESEYAPSDILYFLADCRIPLVKWEREEPTLESLFMEVTEK